jgi:hypothetical protein
MSAERPIKKIEGDANQKRIYDLIRGLVQVQPENFAVLVKSAPVKDFFSLEIATDLTINNSTYSLTLSSTRNEQQQVWEEVTITDPHMNMVVYKNAIYLDTEGPENEYNGHPMFVSEPTIDSINITEPISCRFPERFKRFSTLKEELKPKAQTELVGLLVDLVDFSSQQ